jgi:hypothetical protein
MAGVDAPTQYTHPRAAAVAPPGAAAARPSKTVLAVLLCLLLAAEVVGGGYWVYRRITGVQRVVAAIRQPAPVLPAPGAGAALPPVVGAVTIDRAVTDPRAADIAAVLDTHFTAINNKDYAKALSVFDPAGAINPADPTHARRFQQGVSTTVDSDIVLRGVSQEPSPTAPLRVRVTFRSEQQPGFGPRGREQERCTRWDVTHEMSVSPPDIYRILRSTDGANAPC